MKSKEEIIQYLKNTIEEVSLGNIKAFKIQESDKILNLGLDSLDFAAVMLATEHFVGCKVNENKIEWRKIATVEQLAEVLYLCQK